MGCVIVGVGVLAGHWDASSPPALPILHIIVMFSVMYYFNFKVGHGRI
jgi:hypothetical protein